jgi:hypothetical protein
MSVGGLNKFSISEDKLDKKKLGHKEVLLCWSSHSITALAYVLRR